jgi:acetyl-CoA carboxylase carboxyltransferase component/biotin carboxyl carrier protein/biotin carboxylase
MQEANGLGRVVVVDMGEGGRRVLRAIRELARLGRAKAAIAAHGPLERHAAFLRDADETFEAADRREALAAARPDAVWIGKVAPAARIELAAWCAENGVRLVGPSAETLRKVSPAAGLGALSRELGVGLAGPTLAPGARLVEAVVARDVEGRTRVVGLGVPELRIRELVAVAGSGAADSWSERERSAVELAVRACQAAGWVGVAAVQVALEESGKTLLVGLEPAASAGPAIEAVSGVDLVRLSLAIAAGEPVGGAAAGAGAAFAVSARILPRDPDADLRGAPGRVERLRLPADPFFRVEAELDEGDVCAPSGAVATVVALADGRREALARLAQGLEDADVLVGGRGTTKAWIAALCAHPEVLGGASGDGAIARLAAGGERLVGARPEVALVAAALETYDLQLVLERQTFLAEARRGRPRVGPSSGRVAELRYEGQRYRIEVRQTGPSTYRVVPAGGAPVDVKVERLGERERRLVVGEQRTRVLSSVDGLRLLVEIDGVPHAIQREPAGLVVSPMPAVVVAIPVHVGQRVAAGEPVARVESMKVEVVVSAPSAGVVREIVTVANAQVDAGAPLLRLDPDDAEPAAEARAPLALRAPPPPSPATPRERYLAALDELRRVLLGFDVAPAEAKKLAAGWAELSGAVVSDDPQVLAAEEAAFSAFVDIQSLFSRTAYRDGVALAKPPLEELWRYLHEPEQRGAGLSPEFVEGLRRALSHYGVALAAPGFELENALLRIQKAHERASEPMPPILGILERRLASQTPALDERGPETRRLLDRLTELGRELHRPLADLASELRYQRFDQPLFEATRAAAYVQAEKDFAALATVRSAERDAVISRLVACAQPLATLLVERMASAAPGLRPRLVETLLRRYYRIAPVGPVTARVEDGVSCAIGEYASEGRRVRLHACFALASEVEAAARVLAKLAAEAPPEVELALELYLWSPVPTGSHDEHAARLRTALGRAGFSRPVRRAAVAVAFPGHGLGRNSSQEHFTFRGGPGDFTEDARYRGVHPMLFRRMQLGRLCKFDLERLPSVEDVFLYLGVARDNPKDERLFAVAEVRDLTPVRDAAGKVVQLPHLERMLHEALAGMRRFQAHRAPDKRLEWNRVLLTVEPPLLLSREEIRSLAERLAPETDGLGLEVVLIDVRVPDPFTGALRNTLLRVHTSGSGVSIRYDVPTDRPLEPMGEYQQRVIQLRRRGLTHPFELVRMLAPSADSETGVPPGEFVEHDLDASGDVLVPVERPPGKNAANIVAGLMKSFTRRYPEGMQRVALLSDPSRAMGSLAEPECRRILAGLDLAEKLKIPLEWFAVSAGAKISMESGTENMDWISKVLRRIIEFTQRGGEINIVVCGINVGGQPYWNAEATMLMHTRGILVMVAGSSMVLTGKDALDYSGSVSAEDNLGIGGYDRIMGPNGQAQYRAASIAEGIQILLRHYDHTYLAPGERFPRRAATRDPAERDVRSFPHGPAGGAGFETVGEIFSAEKNPDRKKPFDIRRVMAAVIDQDHASMERWRDLRGGDTSVVWDAHLGGWPVCLLGIEARPLPRLEFVPADGPELWSSGTLFPMASKKLARAINGASGIRPVVVLANLSGFDGSPESMRRIQLEYGAEIGRAVVNFQGPFVFCVVSRYHGGAFVVFSKALREDIEVIAVEGARASVIGGAPAAATVFAREVETRTRKDPRVVAAEEAARKTGSRLRLAEVITAVRSEKVGEVAEEFDGVHTVERALKVGSLDRIIPAKDLRPYLIDAVERGISKHQP